MMKNLIWKSSPFEARIIQHTIPIIDIVISNKFNQSGAQNIWEKQLKINAYSIYQLLNHKVFPNSFISQCLPKFSLLEESVSSGIEEGSF